MTDGEMKKFLFDNNDFDAAKPPPAPPPVTYSEEQLLLAKTQNFAQGKEEGIAETRAAQEQEIQQCLQRLAQMTGQLVMAEDRRELEQMINAAKLALRVARKLMPDLSRRFALPEIERTIIEAIAARRDEPRITISVPPAHLDALRGRMEGITHAGGFAGKVALVADDALAQTDCRIEWADGGAERLFEGLFKQIEDEFEKAVGGMKATMDAAEAAQEDKPETE
jgi:flagellar assembly protein FliH